MTVAVHAFLAIPLDRDARAELGTLQQALRDALKGHPVALNTVPRRALSLPLHDLGDVPSEAFEAVTMAVGRVAAQHAGFTLPFDAVGAFPDERRPQQPFVRLADPKGRLAALRSDLGQALAGYGFALDPRAFVPHVPLARLDGDGPALPNTLKLPNVGLRVHEIDLVCLDTQQGWRTAQTWPLPRFVDAAPALPLTDPQTLARLLDERLAERAQTQTRAPRRRKRSPATGDTP
ncbi:MAG: RNA 2',3'-cyclic phosphodiesterase [Myxococcales bacterium]|nr:RNA 2',3'-cyclic phosphodiesterase [Myxococcales bacterium]MCB9525045.1 RNA 2',3'-cyclic phosphodiesterase [Myxococcales bacterium]